MSLKPLLTAGPLLAALFIFLPGQALAQKNAQEELLAGLAQEYRPEGAPDHQAAATHYQAAARAGSREALLALARLHAPDGPLWRTAEVWRGHLLAAAEAGWPSAAFELGEAIEKGAVPAGSLEPFLLFQQAAAAGHGPAALRLGQL
ncbi:MAG: hypothetical protein LBS31_10685, partial [Candidatus Adiutrix sp.]|nr:hypothetical protein [Candidatus Adiutrix sp.]